MKEAVMSHRLIGPLLLIGMTGVQTGCHHPTVTAVSLAPHVCDQRCSLLRGCHDDPEGIPFYLPKPLLIVSKNFRNIEDAKVGLTDSPPIPNTFDDQSKYADLNARTNFNFDGTGASTATDASGGGKAPAALAADPTNPPDPGATKIPPASTASKSGAYAYSPNPPNVTPHDVPSDGLAPNTFYTYQIVFVPDLTQKYGLKIKGGVGEIRAAMNLVNGWQFTGLGPYYMKDSSTAQDVMASGIAARLGGQAAQDVLKGVAGLTSGGKAPGTVPANAPRLQSLARTIEELKQEAHPLMTIPNYAEIYVYEATLGPDGQMVWCEIVGKPFDRHYIGQGKVAAGYATPEIEARVLPNAQAATNAASASPSILTGGLHPSISNIISQALGSPIQSAPAGTPTPATTPGILGAQPSGNGLLHHEKKRRGTAISRVFNGVEALEADLTGIAPGPALAAGPPVPAPRYAQGGSVAPTAPAIQSSEVTPPPPASLQDTPATPSAELPAPIP
jgi:hypothetical protein